MRAPSARGARETARPPRLAAALLALLMLASGPARTALADSPTPADTRDALHQARLELRRTKDDIRGRMAKLRLLQRRMNRLATRISRNEDQINHALLKIHRTQRAIADLQHHLRALNARLAERSRQAYMMGPATPMVYLLTASSAADAAERISLLEEMNRRDAVLVEEIAAVRDGLSVRRSELQKITWYLATVRADLHDGQRALRRAMAQSRSLLSSLRTHKEDVLGEISQIRPFAVCPVGEPHAVGDDFGIWVHRSKKWGGDHVHQGNDIMAPEGTPIYAPFDGVAEDATNHIGGQAVRVVGQYGYAYNAHLSAFGQLGPVQTGDVVGYVGHTGDTGANHDHFEWHPDGGPAVDPHDFLMLVC
jgi:murein DD-endopeptidase MepM/ murein hydrolase activator NlpD